VRSTSGLTDAVLWAMTLMIGGLIVFFSIGPQPSLPPFGYSDKAAHGFAYAALTLTLLLVAVWRPVRGPGRFTTASIPIVVATVAAGAALEVLQGGLFQRDPELLDWLAEVVGVGAAVVAWRALRREEAATTSR
jgi:VanZ family protein